MNIHIVMTVLLISLPVGATRADNKTVDSLLKTYSAQGATGADAERGRQLWQKKFAERSCTSCHTQDLAASGKHVTTSKIIEPMAPSANTERLTDARKVEKWFLRNCKWTLGRECTAQEKADFIVYINN